MLSSNQAKFHKLPFKQSSCTSFLKDLLLTQPDRKLYDKHKLYQRMGIS